MIAGDMPIGLPEARQLGGRECDRQARQQTVEYPRQTLLAHHITGTPSLRLMRETKKVARLRRVGERPQLKASDQRERASPSGRLP